MRRKLLSALLATALGAVATSSAHAQAMEHQHAKAPASTELKVTVDGKTATLSLTDLAALPQKTVIVHNEHTKADETYIGAALSDLLTKQGFAVNQTTHQKLLRSYVTAEGT